MSSELKVDTISEKTGANGVVIDGVKLKDNAVETNTISEGTSGSGVTIDGALLKDSKVAASAGGGLVLINKTTLSSSTYGTVDNVFSSTYTHYKIIGNFAASVTKELRLRFRTGGASGSDHTTSSLYLYNYNYAPLGAATGQTHLGASANDYLQIASAFSGNTGFEVKVFCPNEAKNTLATWTAAGSQSGTDYLYNGGGLISDTTALTGFGFYTTDSASLTGEILTYGYNEG